MHECNVYWSVWMLHYLLITDRIIESEVKLQILSELTNSYIAEPPIQSAVTTISK